MFNRDFASRAPKALFERCRRIFGHFCRSSLFAARDERLIHAKTGVKIAEVILSNTTRHSWFNEHQRLFFT
jgi:hypothetical protein